MKKKENYTIIAEQARLSLGTATAIDDRFLVYLLSMVLVETERKAGLINSVKKADKAQ